jgi:integrase
MGKLTKAFVERERRAGRYGDGDGLVLEIGPTGAKSWTLRYQRNGKAHWMGLGSVKLLSLPEARERGRLARLELLDGRDPLEARRAQHAEQAKAAAATITFRDAAARVIEDREADWSAEHARQWRASIDEVDSVLGAIPVAKIDTPLVLKAVEPIWKRAQVTGKRTLNRIEIVLDWAKARGSREGDNPARWEGHMQHLLKNDHTVKHHEAMPYTAVADFVADLRARPGVTAKALEFLVLCAARSGEVLGTRWDEINLKAKTWTVPPERLKTGKKKPDKPHVVPLSSAALKILAALPRDGEHVFTHGGKQMERHALADLMKKVMGRSETVHGLRSTFTDWAADNTAYPQEVREQALAHAIPKATEKAYRRGQLLEKRARLMAEWARYCDSPAAPAGEVVPIRRG